MHERKIQMERARVVINGIDQGFAEFVEITAEEPDRQYFPNQSFLNPGRTHYTLVLDGLHPANPSVRQDLSATTFVLDYKAMADIIKTDELPAEIFVKPIHFSPAVIRHICNTAHIGRDEALDIMKKLSLYEEGEYRLVKRPKKKET